MSDRRKKAELHQRRELQNAGWGVSKTDSIQFNSGSETVPHLVCKALVGFVLRQRGYRVDSEVTHDTRGEIDIIGYGHERRTSPIAVECETKPTEEVIDDKLYRYYEGTPIKEVHVLNVSDMPLELWSSHSWVGSEL